MINRTTKTKWLNALRSDRFKTSQGPLKRKDTYNVLGVLCKITGNARNRDMTYGLPSIDGSTIRPFMGLSPNTQLKLIKMPVDQAIRYISRNIKSEV